MPFLPIHLQEQKPRSVETPPALVVGITVTIRGDSYRLKEKLKAGLMKGTEASA